MVAQGEDMLMTVDDGDEMEIAAITCDCKRVVVVEAAYSGGEEKLQKRGKLTAESRMAGFVQVARSKSGAVVV